MDWLRALNLFSAAVEGDWTVEVDCAVVPDYCYRRWVGSLHSEAACVERVHLAHRGLSRLSD